MKTSSFEHHFFQVFLLHMTRSIF